MHDDAFKISIANENLNLLCDLELILGLYAILPLLDYACTLIKFAQSHNMFICDVNDAMKIYQLKFYNDPYNKFDELNVFWNIHQQESIDKLVCRPKWWGSQLPYWIIFLVLNNIWTIIVF